MDFAAIKTNPLTKDQVQVALHRFAQDPLTRTILQAEGSLSQLLMSLLNDPKELRIITVYEQVIERTDHPDLSVNHNETLLLKARDFLVADTLLIQQEALLVIDRLQELKVPLLPSPHVDLLYERLFLRRRLLRIKQTTVPGNLVRTYCLEAAIGPVALVTEKVMSALACFQALARDVHA